MLPILLLALACSAWGGLLFGSGAQPALALPLAVASFAIAGVLWIAMRRHH
jgi:L-asparagine transporter-like permease